MLDVPYGRFYTKHRHPPFLKSCVNYAFTPQFTPRTWKIAIRQTQKAYVNYPPLSAAFGFFLFSSTIIRNTSTVALVGDLVY